MNTDCSDSTTTIAIVGAGFSGTLTAVNLLRADLPATTRVLLIERTAPHGRGLAYGTWDDNFLLNVPAGNMSAFTDLPDHFVAFCRNIDPAFSATSFIPRRLYGDYIESLLADAEARHPGRLIRITGEAAALRRADNGVCIDMADSRRFAARQVVLSFGHLPPKPLPLDTHGIPFIASPWDFDAMDRLDTQRPVLLIGCGHTAIDTLFRLTRSSTMRRIFLLSRRGQIPREHRFLPRPPITGGFPSYLDTLPCTVRAYARALRDEARAHMAAGGDWRDVINELRPHIPGIWSRLTTCERHRFVTHAQAIWDVHRHRLAPSAHQRLSRMLASGQVEVLAGKVAVCNRLGARSEIAVMERGKDVPRRLPVGGIVNCTGPNYDIAAASSPFVVRLRDAGWIRPDTLKLGLDVDEHYRVVNRHGNAAADIFYVGPLLRARYWEAIAVPELRMHCAMLAQRLALEARQAAYSEPIPQ